MNELQVLKNKETIRSDISSLAEQIRELEEKVEFEEDEIEKEKPKMMEMLLKAGHDDFLLTDPEVFRKLIGKRIEILKTLKEEDINSVKELAETTERSWSNVSEDLDILAQEDIIEFEREGREKKPVLKAEKIFFKPLII